MLIIISKFLRIVGVVLFYSTNAVVVLNEPSQITGDYCNNGVIIIYGQFWKENLVFWPVTTCV